MAPRSHLIQAYIEEVLFSLWEEGIQKEEPNLSTSMYFRNLMIADFKRRNLLTPEIIDALLTGEPLKMPVADDSAA